MNLYGTENITEAQHEYRNGKLMRHATALAEEYDEDEVIRAIRKAEKSLGMCLDDASPSWDAVIGSKGDSIKVGTEYAADPHQRKYQYLINTVEVLDKVGEYEGETMFLVRMRQYYPINDGSWNAEVSGTAIWFEGWFDGYTEGGLTTAQAGAETSQRELDAYFRSEMEATQ